MLLVSESEYNQLKEDLAHVRKLYRELEKNKPKEIIEEQKKLSDQRLKLAQREARLAKRQNELVDLQEDTELKRKLMRSRIKLNDTLANKWENLDADVILWPNSTLTIHKMISSEEEGEILSNQLKSYLEEVEKGRKFFLYGGNTLSQIKGYERK